MQSIFFENVYHACIINPKFLILLHVWTRINRSGALEALSSKWQEAKRKKKKARYIFYGLVMKLILYVNIEMGLLCGVKSAI